MLERCRTDGLLVGKSGLYGNVLKVAPPMTVTSDEVTTGARDLTRALREAAA